MSSPFVSVWCYRVHCCSDESSGKPCNDRGSPRWGKRKHFEAVGFPGCIWAPRQLFCSWGTCQRNSWRWLQFTCDKDHPQRPLNRLINDLLIVSMKQIIWLASRDSNPPWQSDTAFANGLTFLNRGTHFPPVLLFEDTPGYNFYTKIYRNII